MRFYAGVRKTTYIQSWRQALGFKKRGVTYVRFPSLRDAGMIRRF
jgi:hypothetical protein